MALILKNTLSLHAMSRVVRSIFAFKRYVSRKDCDSYNGPRCVKEHLEKLQPCPAKLRRMEANENPSKSNSTWENPECCMDPCPDYASRFDEVYYKTSNKLQRKYQQTWIGCPELQMKPKLVCSSEQYEFPPLEKRSPKERPQTACSQTGSKICMENRPFRKCPSLKMPLCQGMRSPPKCKRERFPSDCKKDCTPYPSYSECLRSNIDPPLIECKCLNHPMMCEVWAEMRRRMTFVK